MTVAEVCESRRNAVDFLNTATNKTENLIERRDARCSGVPTTPQEFSAFQKFAELQVSGDTEGAKLVQRLITQNDDQSLRPHPQCGNFQPIVALGVATPETDARYQWNG